MHLALAFGRMDVDAMLREIGSRQLHEWLSFGNLEGFGEKRADMRMGIVASLVANVNRDPKRKPSPFKPTDFIPKLKEDEARQQESELRANLERMSRSRR
jgi:hypothetical protein